MYKSNRISENRLWQNQLRQQRVPNLKSLEPALEAIHPSRVLVRVCHLKTVLGKRRQCGNPGMPGQNPLSSFPGLFHQSRNGTVYQSRFSDGRHAPVHVMAGLPSKLALKISATGRVVALIDSVVAGFLRDGHFYSRREAADYTAPGEATKSQSSYEITKVRNNCVFLLQETIKPIKSCFYNHL